jgi:hypothetical protein
MSLTKDLITELTKDVVINLIEDGIPVFLPSDISNLGLWLDSSDASTITESGGAVSQWDDKSGNGNHATQGTGSLQPLYEAVAQNGKPGIKFDLDYLGRSTFTGGALSQNITIFAVFGATQLNHAINPKVYDGPDNVSSKRVLLQVENLNGSQPSIYSGTASVGALPAISLNQLYYSTAIYGGSGELYIDGDLRASGNTGNNLMNGIFVGSHTQGNVDMWKGYINEILVYDKVLSTQERQQVENYLTNKWSFLPSDISDLGLWLDSSDASTITESLGSVSAWNDKSGNGNNFTQAVLANQPTTGSRTINGLNVLDFNGTTEEMVGPTGLITTLNTVFIVFKTDVKRDQFMLGQYISGDPDRMTWGMGGSTFGFDKAQVSIGGVSGDIFGTTALSLGQTYVHTSSHSATTLKLYVNGVQEGTLANSRSALNTVSTVGSLNSFLLFDGCIAEILFYSRVLGTSEQNQVENYLINKWNV